jgi:hypothetical protein
MVRLGARSTDAEIEQVTDYLATNFKGEAPKPISRHREQVTQASPLRARKRRRIAYRNTKGVARHSTI